MVFYQVIKKMCTKLQLKLFWFGQAAEMHGENMVTRHVPDIYIWHKIL
jgi:hypothetical protein